MSGTRFPLEVRPQIPAELPRLPELANNLIYTWDRDLRHLFRQLNNALYEACSGNLGVFLRRLAQSDLDAAARNPAYRDAYQRVIASYDAYHARQMPADLCAHLDPKQDLVAYFCFEFGFHESLPLYSGGLGILAGDHCKASSDLAVPLVGIGLLYHQGFFEQHIDARGRQVEQYKTTQLEDLPLQIATDADGREVTVSVPIGTDNVRLRIWRGKAGHTSLYLLDSDLPENRDVHRSITYRLYGGDESTRVMQEIVLGIGGVRALNALGIKPTVWHLNEGHAAFQIIERCHEKESEGLPFAAALEQVAAATVFTTHTPVAAGHDVFSWAVIEQHLGHYLHSIAFEVGRLLQLGNSGQPDRVNMTSLALRGSRHHNGVSKVHGRVASANERYVWPEIPPDENPIESVTNGVHLQTFLAIEWVNLFDIRFADWRANLSVPEYWSRIDTIPDHQFWSIRQELTAELFADVDKRLRKQHQANGLAHSTIERATRLLREPARDVLVLGFARRFATYKRATLIFSERERLARLLNDPQRPVVLIVAGKAHPHDEPGKRLIEQVYELSMKPEFIGKVLLVENYDLALARKLVAGVDVWLNNPEYPLEASGTSGMKAAVNGAINLSVLDGWWAEGFDGSNGWGINPHDVAWDSDYRFREEGRDLIDLLENHVIPTYFQESDGDWIRMAKASMRTIIPRFNAERMVREYVEKLYCPAARQNRALATDHAAERLADWKKRVGEQWHGVRLERIDTPKSQAAHGEAVVVELRAELAGLLPQDVRVECVVDQGDGESITFRATEMPSGSSAFAAFRLEFVPPFPGLQTYQVRMYPHHELLSHPFEMGRMLWI